MRVSSSLSAPLFLTFLAPSFAAASWFDGAAHAVGGQLTFDSPALHRVPSTRPNRTQKGSQQQQQQAQRANPSVVVRVVDPASPSTARGESSGFSNVEDGSEGDDDEQEDEPNFGEACAFEATFSTCGNFFEPSTGVDHGLFCSPSGVCAGKGAACGATEACSEGLVCNLASHRCVTATAELLRIDSSRKAARRNAAHNACPEGSEVCSSGFGGFRCVHTPSDDQECGACLSLGGRDCSAIPHALATSCRQGNCRVHACVGGYSPNEEGTECLDDLIYA
ncbi:hypothetical protein JCM6882_002023 [Rhodosporidiobolus microsporus]